MSCISNCRIADLVAPGAGRSEGVGCGRPPKKDENRPASQRRRELVAAIVDCPLACLPAVAAPAASLGLRRWGSGDFRRFGFLVYHATLWASDDPSSPPLALLGYVPGSGAGLPALSFAYALLPLVFKTLAATLLWRWRHHLEI